ncbi:MAG: 30S ribosomal protein S19 [Candidatus Thermoplasmatota archaeon]
MSKGARRKLRKRKGAIAARRKKEFTYRGHTLDELQKMSMGELLAILPARGRRSYRRGLNEEQQTFVERLLRGEKPVLRTHKRDVIVLPSFVGKNVAVHNGKEFKMLEIKPEMIGHYLGEFALTRKSVRHSGPGVGATRSSKFLPLK